MNGDLCRDRLTECEGKAQFASKAHALSKSKHMKGGISVYKCRFCDKYHVGHSRGSK